MNVMIPIGTGDAGEGFRIAKVTIELQKRWPGFYGYYGYRSTFDLPWVP